MPLTTVQQVKTRLNDLANERTAVAMQRFFKTGPGQYGEGDRFIGINVPPMRIVAKDALGLPIAAVVQLLHSPIHEYRAVALMIMVLQFERCEDPTRKTIYDAYLANTKWINNWDLVDLSAPAIVGQWLEPRSRKPLVKLAKSESLWERRIAIVSTLHLIRLRDFTDTLRVSELLLGDKHDLIHKAVGWMLREVYKRDAIVATEFIEQNAGEMPRTSLRYAIERCKPAERERLMKINLPSKGRSR